MDETEARRIWAEPLTKSEEYLIEKALKDDNQRQMRMWLRHCLKMLVAQRGGE